ncbi:hypothetical protein NDU88_006315 [Pleurodeles waltl]|uniref:Uncharacterized protein n=1 Tax=Pleurodeles waltl TaxID=8319 RepID=A0AAV7QLM5_PLEWA|nr:hypothetical protein NDU88_006315 [Pleurodeles waltl]
MLRSAQARQIPFVYCPIAGWELSPGVGEERRHIGEPTRAGQAWGGAKPRGSWAAERLGRIWQSGAYGLENTRKEAAGLWWTSTAQRAWRRPD